MKNSRYSVIPIVIGSALFWSWGFLCYLSPIMFPPGATLESSIGIEYGFFTSQAVAALFAVVVFFISHWRSLVIRRAAFFIAALGMSLSVPVLAIAIHLDTTPLMIACGVVDGICVPILGVAWGTRYSIHSKSILPLVVLSFLLGYLLYYVVSALPYLVAIAEVALFPLISWMLWRYDALLRHEASAEVFAIKATDTDPGSPGEFLAGTWETHMLPWKSLSILMAISFIGNFIISVILGQGYMGVDALYNGGILVCALLATMTLSILATRKNSPSINDFYTITLAFTMIGLVGILVFGEQGIPVGGAFVQGSALFLQVLIILTVTRSTQETGISPLLSFSIGQGVIAAIVFFANILGKVFHGVFGSSDFALSIICGCGILGLFFMLATRPGNEGLSSQNSSATRDTFTAKAGADTIGKASRAKKGEGYRVSEEVETVGSEDDRATALIMRADEIADQFGLTKREKEILTYLARGRSLPYIADTLFVTTGTVKTHTINIYRKVDVNSRQELLDLIEDFEASPSSR